MGTEGGSLVSPGDPVQLVRRWEAQQGRCLVEPSVAAWEDLDSEAVVLARSRWGVELPSGTAHWRRRRYLSFDGCGVPQRLIEVQLLTSASDCLRTRHTDLLMAGLTGRRYWIYALTPAVDGRGQLQTFQDPARSAWDVATTGSHAGPAEPLWVLPWHGCTPVPSPSSRREGACSGWESSRDLLPARAREATSPRPNCGTLPHNQRCRDATASAAAAELARRPRDWMTQPMGVRALVAATGVAVLLLAGCGQEMSPAGAGGEQPGAGEGTRVECGGSVYDVEDLADAPAASSLPGGPAGAVNDLGEPAFDPALSWSVVHHDEDRADLVRELDEPVDQGGGDIRTHESVTLERITGASNVADGTWMLMSAGSCAQRLLRDDGLRAADITLASDLVPAERALELLVRERECASGQDAEGRIEAEVEETAEQVLLRVAVRPLGGGGGSCPSNPATPFTVELTEPLGDRQVVDASVVPARPVAVAPSQ